MAVDECITEAYHSCGDDQECGRSDQACVVKFKACTDVCDALADTSPSQEGSREYQREVRLAWSKMVKTIRQLSLPPADKVKAIQAFLFQYPHDNRYQKKAMKLLGHFKELEENSFKRSKYDLHTNTEPFALAFGGGYYAGGRGFWTLDAKMGTMRWRHFYWTVFRATFIRSENCDEELTGGIWGTVFGVPLRSADYSPHEWRIGLGLGYGYVEIAPRDAGEEYDWNDYYHRDISSFAMSPEFIYHYHGKKRVDIQLGLRADLFLYGDQKPVRVSAEDYYGNEHTDYVVLEGRLPLVTLSLFAGLTF